MKIAIMGAGLSGLACAITLEKQGIYPTIFEKRSRVGDRFVNGEVIMNILDRPINDAIAYLAEKHHIYLSPVNNIKKMVLCSEHQQAEINGNLGFITIRGRNEDSLENQLANQVKSRIIFNSNHTYENLLKEFTHIILAPGDAAYALKLQDFQKDLTTTIKGAIVEGNFDKHMVMAWLNNTFAPKGYGYFIPFSEKIANISIAYPDYPENRPKKLEKQWEIFFQRASKDLDQTLRIKDSFEITRYIIGICKYPRIGNTFFVGNCFGSIMPMFGFGQTAAILTGVYAALDLCGLGNYIELTKPLERSYNDSLVFRRAIEQLDNSGQDTVVKILNGKLGDKLFNSRNVSPLRFGSHLLKPLIWNKHRKV